MGYNTTTTTLFCSPPTGKRKHFNKKRMNKLNQTENITIRKLILESKTNDTPDNFKNDDKLLEIKKAVYFDLSDID